MRTLRGGLFWAGRWDIRCTYRLRSSLDHRPYNGGFRVAKRQSEPRVVRGGGWCFEAHFCRSANRFRIMPNGRYDNLGLRVARRKK